MDDELKKKAEESKAESNTVIAPSPRNEYIPGSAAPQIQQPEQKPNDSPETEQKPKPSPKPKIRRPNYTFSSVLTVVGIVVVALCAFFLLSRAVSIRQQKITSSIDISAIRKRAEQYGMHAPEDGQVIELE